MHACVRAGAPACRPCVASKIPFLLAQEEERDKREMEGEMSRMLDAPTSMIREYIVNNDIHTLCTFLASPLQMVDYDSGPVRSLIWPTSHHCKLRAFPRMCMCMYLYLVCCDAASGRRDPKLPEIGYVPWNREGGLCLLPFFACSCAFGTVQ